VDGRRRSVGARCGVVTIEGVAPTARRTRSGSAGAVLRVLLILRMEIVESIRHDILRVDSLFQAAGDALHGDGTSAGVGRAVLRVNGDGESVTQGHGCKTHFNADQEILVSSRDGTGVGRRFAIFAVDG